MIFLFIDRHEEEMYRLIISNYEEKHKVRLNSQSRVEFLCEEASTCLHRIFCQCSLLLSLSSYDWFHPLLLPISSNVRFKNILKWDYQSRDASFSSVVLGTDDGNMPTERIPSRCSVRAHVTSKWKARREWHGRWCKSDWMKSMSWFICSYFFVIASLSWCLSRPLHPGSVVPTFNLHLSILEGRQENHRARLCVSESI